MSLLSSPIFSKTDMFIFQSAEERFDNRIVVTVPTGHQRSVESIAHKVEIIYCANVRSGRSFAVADAYEQWTDVSEEEILATLASLPE